MEVLLQLVLSGALVGGVYSLVATGFVITYRSAQVFNIAYGQFAMVGAFVAWTFLGSPAAPRLPLPLGLLLIFVVAILFGLLIERLVFRHMIGRPLFASFMLTLGLLALLQGLAQIGWGLETRALYPLIPKGTVSLGGLSVTSEYLWSFGLAVVLITALMLFFQGTRVGLGLRAAYEDQVAARTLGVSARLHAQIAWALCALIATVGGILIASVSGVSMMLSELVLLVLAVVLVGGLDSFVGCIAGGLILAIGQNLSSYYLGRLLPSIETIFSMILIVIILIIRPSGLFGKRPIERV